MEHRAESIRLATFNIKHGAFRDGYKGHAAKTAEACVSLGADMLALQEVDKGTIRSGFYDMARLAAEASGMVAWFSPTLRYKIGSYGNALLVRGDIEQQNTLMLEGGPRFRWQYGRHTTSFGYEPRNALLATANVKGLRLQVVATHLSTQKQLRQPQLRQIIDCMPGAGEAVVLGDLNMRRKEALPFFDAAHMELVEAPPTFPSDAPSRQIDHIALRGLTSVAVRTIHLTVSDHRAVIVDVVPQA